MTTYSGDFCARLRDLLPLHALGVSLGEEAAPMREHLEGCAACRRELDEHREALALLPFALTPVSPPPELRQRVLERVELGQDDGPVVPPRPRQGQAPQAAPPPPRRRLWGPVALAASLCAALGFGVLLLREHRLRVAGEQQTALLQARLKDATTVARSQEERLQAAEHRLRFLQARTVQVVSLTPPSETEEGASGRILWDQERRAWLFVAFQLPPPPPDRDYQLWFLVKGDGAPRPVSAGVASQLPTGELELSVAVPPDIGEIRAAALTLEPKGGSAKPTTDPVLYGQI